MVRASLLILVIIALSILVSPAHAYFRDLGIGARPLGMGGAYVAAADDGNAILWNAAGLAQLSRQEITTMFSALYVGLEAQLYNEKTDLLGHHFIGYVYPSAWGSFAISWSTFQSQVYDEGTFCLSYGGKLNGRLRAGLNLKRQGWSVGNNEYTRLDRDVAEHGTSRSGVTMDVSIGFSAENVLPADVGLNEKENIPVNLRGGIASRAYKPGDLNISLLSAFDIVYRVGDGPNVHIGAECWFFDEIVAARAGWNLDAASGASSPRSAWGLTASGASRWPS